MFKLVALAALLYATALAAPDATPWCTEGTRAPLVLGGRPAVRYEDRGSHDWNQALKEALFADGRGLVDRVRVLAVANIAAFDFFPTREIAMRHIRRLEGQVGVPILLDLRGVPRKPWNLPDDGAAVVVFDRRGEPVLERRGCLSKGDVGATLATLEGLVEEAP